MSRNSTDNVVEERPVENGVGCSSMKCSNCQQSGHNKKGCKNPTVVLPPRPTKKRGRPTKKLNDGPSLVDEDIANFVDVPHVEPEVVVDNGHTNDNIVEEPPVVEPSVEGPKISQKRWDKVIKGTKYLLEGSTNWVDGLE